MVDKRIAKAIEEAVAEAGQPEPVAKRLIAWFDALASGNEDIHDDDAGRRLESLFESAHVEEIGEES